MIDTLRESLATQEQIAEASQNALISLYTIEILLAIVVLLLICLLVTQCRILSALHTIQRLLFEFMESFKAYKSTYYHGVTLHSSTRTWNPRKRRKKRRKVK